MKRYGLIATVMAILVALVLVPTGCRRKSPSANPELVREFANVLYNQQLFKQAIQEYERYLSQFACDEREQANITYIIGDIYFERLRDYENALANYLRIKHLYPSSPLVSEANKKIVACLERLQRSVDAQRALEESSALDKSQIRASRPGEVLARIGNRTITQGDLDFEISQLPPYMQAEFTSREKKLEFLRNLVATELLYDTAKRQGLENDKDVIEGAFQAKRSLMVNKLLQQEIAQKIEMDESALKLYFQAYKDRYAVKDKDGRVVEEKLFTDVRDQVARDYYREKFQEKYEDLVSRVMMAEQAQIYESKVQ
ncbi:MAG: hypothetical protein ONB14_05990 [candidate division KSB1 bacterium]|nr:hypothetical protein [candidate division KSB1 bacterium]